MASNAHPLTIDEMFIHQTEQENASWFNTII